MSHFTPDPALDLVLERTIPVPPERVWDAWTQPELLMQWFTPAPWKTVASELDVRPGGRCLTTMESPEGERFPNEGCYLQVEPNRLLVFTSVMTADFRPLAPSDEPGDTKPVRRAKPSDAKQTGDKPASAKVAADAKPSTRPASDAKPSGAKSTKVKQTKPKSGDDLFDSRH